MRALEKAAKFEVFIMPDDVFLKPRLVGSRFDGHAIPLEVLADFAGLNELLIETAKWAFLRDHPERKRSPRGFAKGLELRIVGIEDGSARPVIQLVVAVASIATPALFPSDAQAYMERARDIVIDTIDAAATGKEISLPPNLLAHFERFGRSLEDGEYIEFREERAGQPAVRLDKRTRRTLLLAPTDVSAVTDSAAVVVVVPDLLQSKETFEMELPDGRRIAGPLTRQHRDAIFEAARGYQDRQRVLIEGVGQYDRSSRLIGIDSIDAVTSVDPLDIGVQIDELRKLKPGWFNGDGKAYAHPALERLEGLFYTFFPDDLPLPHLYPTPEGYIRAEWSLSPHEASLEVDPATFSGYWHTLNLENDADDAFDLRLAEPADWARLTEELRKLSGGHP